MIRDKLKVFMIMPFYDEIASSNYQHSLKPICESLNLDLRRADEIYGTSPIYDDIVKEIQNASIIIADISGKNANVFYELGIAHVMKQNRTIMITQDSFSDVPFDVKHFRIISYSNTIAGSATFKETFALTLNSLLADHKETFRNEFDLTNKIFLSANGYYGSNGASQFGQIMPVLSVQMMPT